MNISILCKLPESNSTEVETWELIVLTGCLHHCYGHQSVRTAAVHGLIVTFLQYEIVIPDTSDHLEKLSSHAEHPGVESSAVKIILTRTGDA